MRLSFFIGALCLFGLMLISGGSMLVSTGAVLLIISAAVATIGFMVIHASKRSSVKFDPGLYYKAARRSQ